MNRLEKGVTLILVMTMILFIALYAMQSYKTQVLSEKVRSDMDYQRQLFEQNKEIILEIEYLNSPQRIDKLVDELALEKVNPKEIVRIEVDESGR